MDNRIEDLVFSSQKEKIDKKEIFNRIEAIDRLVEKGISYEVLEKLEEKELKILLKTNFLIKKVKKSIFSKVKEEDLEEIGKLIFSKELSYKKGLEVLKEKYEELKESKMHAFRHFLIKNGYVNNRSSFESIVKNISKGSVAQKKQKIIINEVVKELLANHLDEIVCAVEYKLKNK